MDAVAETQVAEKFLSALDAYQTSENPSAAFSRCDEIFESLIETWTRKDLLLFLFKWLHENASLMTDEVDDYFDGWFTALVGDCGPASIVKFPGDPDDPDERAAEVRSQRLQQWLKIVMAKERGDT